MEGGVSSVVPWERKLKGIECRERESQGLSEIASHLSNEERGFGCNRPEFESWLCRSLALWSWAAT